MSSWLAYSAGLFVTGVPVRHNTGVFFLLLLAIFTAAFVLCAVDVLQ
jgi:hypothetical protein